MTKAEIVNNISGKLGLEKSDTQRVVESFMEEVIKSLVEGENVYLRGFGSFTIKKKKKKTGRNITKGTSIIIPAHNVPTFKPAKTFIEDVKSSEANVIK